MIFGSFELVDLAFSLWGFAWSGFMLVKSFFECWCLDRGMVDSWWNEIWLISMLWLLVLKWRCEIVECKLSIGWLRRVEVIAFRLFGVDGKYGWNKE
jgi:hypothetical protein